MALDVESIWKSLKNGVWVTAAVMLANWLFSAIGMVPTQVFGVQPASGVSANLGQRLVSVLSNILPSSFNMVSALYLYIGVVATLFVGMFAYEYVKIPSGMRTWKRLAVELAYGTGILALILAFTGLPAWETVVGLGIYYSVVALIAWFGREQLSSYNLI